MLSIICFAFSVKLTTLLVDRSLQLLLQFFTNVHETIIRMAVGNMCCFAGKVDSQYDMNLEEVRYKIWVKYISYIIFSPIVMHSSN